MKNLTILVIFISLSLTVKSQIHWLINQDSISNCKMIQSGKFVYQVTGCDILPGYYIIIENGISTEYIENGKYYVKSKIDFSSPCEYTSTVLEFTIPEFYAKVGDKFKAEIVGTSTIDNLIKIKSKVGGEWKYFVLEKVESMNEKAP